MCSPPIIRKGFRQRNRKFTHLLAAAVGAGEDLEEVAVGVLEIDASAAVVPADFAGAFSVWIGPVLEPSIADAAEDLVEVVFADQKGIVLGRDLAVVIVEVNGNIVVERDDEHRAERLGARQSEDFCEEVCRLLLVAAPDDRVV